MTEDLIKLVHEGIVADLFKAERAISVINSISKKAKSINSEKVAVYQSFGHYQQVCLNEYVLSIARIYDKESKSNNVRCLEKLINKLRNKDLAFPEIKELYQTKIFLQYHNLPTNIIELLTRKEEIEFRIELGEYLYMEWLTLDATKYIVKGWRDEILSHNDTNKKVYKIEFNDTEKLLDFAWKVVTIVGWAYLNTVYGIQNRYHLKEDAQIYGHRVSQLLEVIVGNEQNET